MYLLAAQYHRAYHSSRAIFAHSLDPAHTHTHPLEQKLAAQISNRANKNRATTVAFRENRALPSISIYQFARRGRSLASRANIFFSFSLTYNIIMLPLVSSARRTLSFSLLSLSLCFKTVQFFFSQRLTLSDGTDTRERAHSSRINRPVYSSMQTPSLLLSRYVYPRRGTFTD